MNELQVISYKEKIIDMVNEMENFDFLESIYWFVRTLFKKK